MSSFSNERVCTCCHFQSPIWRKIELSNNYSDGIFFLLRSHSNKNIFFSWWEKWFCSIFSQYITASANFFTRCIYEKMPQIIKILYLHSESPAITMCWPKKWVQFFWIRNLLLNCAAFEMRNFRSQGTDLEFELWVAKIEVLGTRYAVR